MNKFRFVGGGYRDQGKTYFAVLPVYSQKPLLLKPSYRNNEQLGNRFPALSSPDRLARHQAHERPDEPFAR